MKKRIMYIECKAGELTGTARIGWVSFSGSGKTLYYDGKSFQSLKGVGYKSNFYNIETNCDYWISGPKKNGQDTLYPGIIEIDGDAREDYWRTIRQQPENVEVTVIRSDGKHVKWRSRQYRNEK